MAHTRRRTHRYGCIDDKANGQMNTANTEVTTNHFFWWQQLASSNLVRRWRPRSLSQLRRYRLFFLTLEVPFRQLWHASPSSRDSW